MELFRAMILMLYLFLCAFIMVNMELLMRKLSDRMLQFWLKDVKNIIEERGSEFLAVSYQGQITVPWQCYYLIRNFKAHLSKHCTRVVHIYKQNSSTADFLASVAIYMKRTLISICIPKGIQDLALLDLPSLD